MRIRFGAFADLHYAKDGMRERGYSGRALEDMKKGMERFVSENVDFVVSLGDNLQPSENRSVQYQLMKQLIKEWSSYGVPVHAVFGNHEFQQLSLADVLELWQTDRAYYSFELKGMRFVILDANVNPDGSHFSEGNFEWISAILPKEQVLWLKQLLADKKPTVILTHTNLYYPPDVHYYIRNQKEVLDILAESGCVKAVIQGHNHKFHQCAYEGIRFINIPSIEFSEAYTDNDFPIIEVGGNNILYNGVPVPSC